MTIQINYKNSFSKQNSSNLVLFVDEKFNILSLKKHINSSEFPFISELLKGKDLNEKIISFDLTSKRKIILISLKKNITSSEVENLGAKFYDLFKKSKQNEYVINSNTISIKIKNCIGHFLHGLKLKSYTFNKYLSKKTEKKISFTVIGIKKPSQNDQIKFKAIEEGTFYTRDLVSEPGNILHPDEYAKRLYSLRKIGLKINIYDQKKLKKL